MKSIELKRSLLDGSLDMRLMEVYGGKAEAMSRREYYSTLTEAFERFFPECRDCDIRLFSAPGRTEVGGNHTDHNHGKVLAASIDLDCVAAVCKTDIPEIRIDSVSFPEDKIDLNDLAFREEEKGTSASLIRGICHRFKELGYSIGGFNAAQASRVLKGSGLSSSAAYEVLIGTILNCLYNDGKISPVEIAIISQYAENNYFGKPCGLMDQTACSVGGFVEIDFENNDKPVIERIDFDFESSDYVLCIVDTGGNHADLTADYAAIKGDMCAVAAVFGCEYLREVPFEKFWENVALVREKAGDRAVMRALHFYNENLRVDKEAAALKNGDFEKCLHYIQESGESSFMYNQNVFTPARPLEQPVSLALAMSEQLLGRHGVWRVHGGGFAGTIQVFLPRNILHNYMTKMKSVFGEKSCYILTIRQAGGSEI